MTEGKNLYFDGLITTSKNSHDWEAIGQLMSVDKSFGSYMMKRNSKAAEWMNKAGSLQLMEGVLPTMVQSGLGSYAGWRASIGRMKTLGSYGRMML